MNLNALWSLPQKCNHTGRPVSGYFSNKSIYYYSGHAIILQYTEGHTPIHSQPPTKVEQPHRMSPLELC
jgi:hypothetical protein